MWWVLSCLCKLRIYTDCVLHQNGASWQAKDTFRILLDAAFDLFRTKDSIEERNGTSISPKTVKNIYDTTTRRSKNAKCILCKHHLRKSNRRNCNMMLYFYMRCVTLFSKTKVLILMRDGQWGGEGLSGVQRFRYGYVQNIHFSERK